MTHRDDDRSADRAGWAPSRDDGDEPGSGDEDFAPDDLAMLRDFFRDEAHDALERVTAQLLSTAGPVGAEVVAEMLRTTHTLKGSAGTVGLPRVVGLAHAFEDHLARLPGRPLAQPGAVREALVAAVDGLRSAIDAAVIGGAGADDTGADDTGADDTGAGGHGGAEPEPWPAVVQRFLEPLQAIDAPTEPAADRDSAVPEAVPAMATGRADRTIRTRAIAPEGAVSAYEPGEDTTRSIVTGAGDSGEIQRPGGAGVLRVEPARIDRLMNSASELEIDRTRLARRVGHIRELVRE
ncbi:MAG: Hpt domain-containing protein, partial [Myxococcota bacterium]